MTCTRKAHGGHGAEATERSTTEASSPARRQGPIAGEHGSHRRDVLLREAVLDDDKHVEIADPRHEVPNTADPWM